MPYHSEISDPSYDERGNRRRVAALRNAGVMVWSADRVFIGPEVPKDGIEPGAMLMNAVIRGEQTAIGAESRVGTSGTAVVVDTQIGRGVELGAGTYRNTTLFDHVRVRGFAELRQGTVLEEFAETGHNVGLKNTFFTTGVVAGSLINFCDVLVTGGSSREDHTEIGSGAVHFNFDPRGDKFGSLVGDARGLLLRQKRIFIGGNSGVVAPLEISFGAVIPAGAIVREDVDRDSIFTNARQPRERSSPKHFDPNVYRDLSRKFMATANLCGNLQALESWYRTVRLPFASGLESVLYQGAVTNIRVHMEHRARELEKLITKLVQYAGRPAHDRNPFRAQHLLIGSTRKKVLTLLTQAVPAEAPADFLQNYRKARASADHCTVIRDLPERIASDAERWLAGIASSPGDQLRALFEERPHARVQR